MTETLKADWPCLRCGRTISATCAAQVARTGKPCTGWLRTLARTMIVVLGLMLALAALVFLLSILYTALHVVFGIGLGPALTP